MKTRLLPLLFLLLATMALLAFGMFTNVLTDLLGTDIKEFFRNNPWLIALFALLLGIVWYLYTKIENRSEKTPVEAVDKDQYDEAFVQFRKNLLEQYQVRLNSKTGRRLPINLSAKSTNYGFDPERAKVFLTNQTIESENIASEIDKILKANARLLLIGDPGAGKTTILLYAAINILNTSYSSDEKRPLRSDDSKSSDRSPSLNPKLPLLLNLATWRKGRDFAEWYTQSIAHTYSLNPVFVQELLRRNAVVPFFDGFDEVAEQHRNDCFQKMAAYFHDERKRQLIVSSRKKEYAAAKADAPVYAEIEVQPLSLAQIKRSLSENAESQAADRALLHALDRDRWLAEAVETPFYLNTASFLLGKGQRTLADFPFKAESTEGRQAELVEIFVTEQVPEGRDRKHLSFLAEKMDVENFLVFELVKMQPGWCGNKWRYSLSLSLIIGLLAAFIVSVALASINALIFAYFNKPAYSSIIVFYGLSSSLVAGMTTGFYLGWSGHKIQTNDIEKWNWDTLIQNWNKGLVDGLVRGFSLFLIITLFLLTFDFLSFSKFTKGSVGNIVFSLVFSIIAGLATGLKKSGTITNFFLYIPNPYARFWATSRSFTWIIPAFILALGTGASSAGVLVKGYSWEKVAGLVWHPVSLSFFLPICLLFFLLPLLLSELLQHFSLRLVLYLEGKMPLRVVTFMDRMSEQLIFEDNRRSDKKGNKRRGATWRFRHKILQDYFAGMEAK